MNTIQNILKLPQINKKKIRQSSRKLGERLEQTHHKQLIQMANQHMQRTSLVIKEMQMKPQLDITISNTNNIGEEKERQALSDIAPGGHTEGTFWEIT